MTAKTIKTLGEARQWHLEQGEYWAATLGQSWGRTASFKSGIKENIKLHTRFAKAIERCLPRPF